MPTDQLSKLFKALSDPFRLEVLRVLSADSFGVQELASLFSMPQPGMSHHLKVLSQADLVVSHRQGNSIFYRRTLLKNETEFLELRKTLFSTLDLLPLPEKTQRHVQDIYAQRASQSQNFFNKNSEKFLERQGLLCSTDQYLDSLSELIDTVKIPKSSKVMEVGPGSGELMLELASRFSSVTALDNSPQMLELAKLKLGKVRNVEFVESDLATFAPSAGPKDLVVLNMVLHHMPSPLLTFKKLNQIIAAGGYLIVADLCSHNQEWVRDSCGDVWLGFQPAELDKLAMEGRFALLQSQFLGLKNGFQIQLKVFRSLKVRSE